jgi:RHS repeat-associated protein
LDNSRWIYTYDGLGQVTSGKKYWVDGTPVAGQQFEYGFDDIGNRTSTKAGGDQSGASLRPASYVTSLLNQHASRTIPGAADILGSATNSATVTVNNQPVYRNGNYFRDELSVDNSAATVWLGVTNLAVLNDGTNPDIIATNIGNAFVPKTPETFGYDADGNTTNDGRWTFTWDAENRLVSMQAISTVPSGAKKKLEYAYDYQGRRTQKIVSTWNGSAYVAASTNKFVYDAWNLIAEINGTNGVIRSYLWGTDLSGRMQGAGGVGGLLAIKPVGTNSLFVAYDGNGNVTGLIDASTGTSSGQFEYGPFGETIRLTPNSNNQSPFRFSTKYTDDESDFLYYGFRYYNPSSGRWLSRDPSEELGGLDLYAFADNSAVNAIDNSGLGVMYIQHANGTPEITFTPPPPPESFWSRLWSGNGNAKAKKKACKSKCDELKALLMKAYVADDVYHDRDGGDVPESPNYERLSEEKLRSLGIRPGEMVDDKSGFYAALYLDHISGNYLVAFRGTELFSRDTPHDFNQGLGFSDSQYNAAASLGTRLGQILPGQISGAGHSLGGGLDTVAALSGGFPAVNFNAAGVHPYTADRLGINLIDAQQWVVNYSTPGDFLTRGANRTYLAPPTDGRQVMLPSPGSWPLGLNRHGTANVIAAIQKALAENGCK